MVLTMILLALVLVALSVRFAAVRAERVPVRVRIAGIDSVPLPDPQAGQPVPVDWDDAQVVNIP